LSGNNAIKERDHKYKVLASIDYEFFVSYVHRGFYQHGAHTKYICKALQDIEEKHARGIPTFTVIELPPRHSKSMTVTETFPSYFIGRDPDRKVIEISYGETLARKFGRSNRDKIEEFGPAIFNMSIDQRNSSATNWSIKGKRGGMISAGIGGSITGEGADLLLIDDPIKNRREADSKTYREFLWNEWQNTLQTRLQPGGSVIILMTRWHEDDLIGRILESDERQWNRIRIPAIAEENDLLGRPEGAALWPEYGFDEEWAEITKKAVGSRTWSALYMQSPRPTEGSLFKRKWIQYYKVKPGRFDEVLQSWDCTFKDTKDSDFVVGQIWGRVGAFYYLLDQVRGQMDFPATLAAIESLTAKWPTAHTKLIEDKANGSAVISVLKRKIPGLIPVNPEGGKEARAAAVSPVWESGNVFLPEPAAAPWIHDYTEELISFPQGKNDDQVDSTTQALIRMINPFEPLIGRA
jgi:predicted phage terminase large subunit-like protein